MQDQNLFRFVNFVQVCSRPIKPFCWWVTFFQTGTSSDGARLEPVLLASVLLFVGDVDTVRTFPLVSRGCQRVMEVLRTNPVATFDRDVATTLALFPNTNTLRVRGISELAAADLPETVTAVVVDAWGSPA